jgi:2-polyprenyl-6-methoxyphenol hydroxylase-like FAD-dependent oxidoreductase
MAQSRKVIVIGGSVGGLFAGVLLHKIGCDVTVYERSVSGLNGRGAGLVSQPDVIQILAEIGAESVFRSGVVARERIVFDRSGEIVHRVETPQSQISWDLLYEAFRSQIPDRKYVTGREAKSVRVDGKKAVVQFSDGQEDHADFVIGADGIGSAIRGFVAPGMEPTYAGYAAYRGLAPETELPPNSAKILSERFSFYNPPGSQILGYLVAGSDGSLDAPKRRYNWVWYRPRTEAALRFALTDSSGVEHRFSLPPGSLSTATLDDLRADAMKLLPPVFADVVLKEEMPFLQVIFDYEAIQRRPAGRRGIHCQTSHGHGCI